MAFIVRSLQSKDEDWLIDSLMAIHILERDHTTLPPPPNFESQLRRWVNALDQQPSALVTIAEYHRKPVGFLIGEADTTPNPLSEWQKRAFIHALWVSPEHRKQGVGRKLVETFEAAIREYNIPYCDLAYHPKNEIAQRFWQALGYQPAQMTARKIFGLQEIEQA